MNEKLTTVSHKFMMRKQQTLNYNLSNVHIHTQSLSFNFTIILFETLRRAKKMSKICWNTKADFKLSLVMGFIF